MASFLHMVASFLVLLNMTSGFHLHGEIDKNNCDAVQSAHVLTDHELTSVFLLHRTHAWEGIRLDKVSVPMSTGGYFFANISEVWRPQRSRKTTEWDHEYWWNDDDWLILHNIKLFSPQIRHCYRRTTFSQSCFLSAEQGKSIDSVGVASFQTFFKSWCLNGKQLGHEQLRYNNRSSSRRRRRHRGSGSSSIY